ncbi:MAG: PTS sugar transporter subunit IIB [Erysipelotrichales bacterium]|nr:PTS sugar transporter subunit IIB [Erysipelotrichales bacterium]
MVHIVLCCASGMSTSLLVEKMKKAAVEQGIEAKIWAVSANEIKDNAHMIDVILLGPQVKYARKSIEANAKGVPIDNISIKDYGMMNGKNVLEQALELIKK